MLIRLIWTRVYFLFCVAVAAPCLAAFAFRLNVLRVAFDVFLVVLRWNIVFAATHRSSLLKFIL